VPWWSEGFALRKKVQTARKRLGRIRRMNITEELVQALYQYKRYRSEYIREIRHCKITSWKNFVIIKGNADPWGLVYKILRNKI